MRGFLDARAPRLPHDTIWLCIDSLDLAQMESLHKSADSLTKESEKLVKEGEKLIARGEKLRTAAAKKWYRNDSLRNVAHLKNVAQADSLALVADSLKMASQHLLDEVLTKQNTSDSIEIVLWGEVVEKREAETKN